MISAFRNILYGVRNSRAVPLAAAVAAVIAAAPVFASADAPPVAVYVAGGRDAGENKALATLILDAFVKSGKYAATGSSDDFTVRAGKEQAKRRGRALEDNDLRKLGAQAGVRFICAVDITPAFGTYQVSARVVDAETGRVAAMGVSRSGMESLDAIDSLAGDIVGKLLGVQAPKAAEPPQTQPPPAEPAPAPPSAEPEPAQTAAERAPAASIPADGDDEAAEEVGPEPVPAVEEPAPVQPPAPIADAPAAAEPENEAAGRWYSAGLRVGVGNAMSADAYLTLELGEISRLDVGAGYRRYDYRFVYSAGEEHEDTKTYNGGEAFGFYGLYTDAGPVCLYAGLGAALFVYEALYYDTPEDVKNKRAYERGTGVSVGPGGHTGLEIYAGYVTFGINARALYYIPLADKHVNRSSEFRFTAGINMGYTF